MTCEPPANGARDVAKEGCGQIGWAVQWRHLPTAWLQRLCGRFGWAFQRKQTTAHVGLLGFAGQGSSAEAQNPYKPRPAATRRVSKNERGGFVFLADVMERVGEKNKKEPRARKKGWKQKTWQSGCLCVRFGVFFCHPWWRAPLFPTLKDHNTKTLPSYIIIRRLEWIIAVRRWPNVFPIT